MEYNDGFVSKEHRELARSASESADPLSVSPLQNPVHSRSPQNDKSPNSPRSPNRVGSSKGISSKGSPKKGSPLKHERHSHSSKDGRPKKGGEGGKGSWGGLLDVDDSHSLDPNNPNFDGSEVFDS
ncbi:MA3 DOMAIN-CONTAINING PROTEIN [Salix purpurea]|uniref:MA3 DOMAIN-CONTAINING PROTEIN n=1 Tax=Salix purpurea TaxID=77065 RepID=A0A9Q0SQB8_SALPP|nr:MA3 DOMAIN-CONTAINING PROTEIN [Salix purpurea]